MSGRNGRRRSHSGGFRWEAPIAIRRGQRRANKPDNELDPSDSSAGHKVSGQQAKANSDWVLLWRIFGVARAFRWRIALLLLVSLLATPLTLLAPVPLKIAVDSVLGSDPLPGFLAPLVPGFLQSSEFRLLIVAAVMQVLVVLLIQVQAQGLYLLQVATGERLTLGFQARLLDHAQRLSFSFHDKRGTADSIYRIQYDAPSIQWVAVYSLIPLLTAFLTLGSMVVVIFAIDRQLALVALAISPFLYLSARTFSLRMRGQYRDAKKVQSDALKVVQEVLTSFRVVKAFGREEDETQRFVRQSALGVRARLRLAVAEGAFGILVNTITATGAALVLFIGIRSVQAETLTLGSLLLVLSYLGQLYGPLKSISSQLLGLQNHLASAQRAFELVDEVPHVVELPDAKQIRRAAGSIAVEDVSFTYDGETMVLNDVSLVIAPGSRIGIAGRTGAGKTTLVSLLTRFYDPTRGLIRLDGVDLKEYKLDDLRRQFGIVLQEPLLFSTTIGDNIAYARPDADFDDVVAAAKAAEAHGFISKLPDGYGTLVGERGMSLSGGERQRISLARAFLKDAPILILDEPTSSVDTETEGSIMEAMERLMAGRTALVVAHRASTLALCETIFEVRKARVIPRRPIPVSTPSGARLLTTSRLAEDLTSD